MIKPAYSVSFLLSINIFVWQNVLYFLDDPRISVLLPGTEIDPSPEICVLSYMYIRDDIGSAKSR